MEADTDPVAYAEFSPNNGWEIYQIDEFSVMAISESFVIKKHKNTIERRPVWTFCLIENKRNRTICYC